MIAEQPQDEPEPQPQQPAQEYAEEFKRVGLSYVWNPKNYPIRLMAEGLADKWDSAEISILDTRFTPPKYISMSRQALMDMGKRRNFGQNLSDLCKHDDVLRKVPWVTVVEQFCIGVIRRHREGEPTQHVKTIKHLAKAGYLIEKLLPKGKPTIWYGPQGAGKGWLTIHACVSIAQGESFAGLKVYGKTNVLYLDWEDDEGTFALRVDAAQAGKQVVDGDSPTDIPNIYYRKMHGQLPRQLPTIMREVAAYDIGLIVIDSVGLAMGAKGENSYEDHAIGFFEALRYLEPVTVLMIDHVTGSAFTSGQLAQKALGSVYKMAEARAAWEIRKEQDTDSDEQIVGMHHTKHNHSQKFGSQGFKLKFNVEGDDLIYVTIDKVDIKSSVELVKQLSQKEQIEAYLADNGASSLDDIAEAVTDKHRDVARAQLNQMAKKGKVLKLPDGRWGLAEGKPQPHHLKPLDF